MAKSGTAGSIDEYIAGLPAETQQVLQDVRELIRAAVPGVTEKISYAIPTFVLNGRYLVYAAGWKRHVSVYPISGAMVEAFGDELKPYLSGKGSAKFPLRQPMPADLIRQIVEFRAREVTGE